MILLPRKLNDILENQENDHQSKQDKMNQMHTIHGQENPIPLLVDNPEDKPCLIEG